MAGTSKFKSIATKLIKTANKGRLINKLGNQMTLLNIASSKAEHGKCLVNKNSANGGSDKGSSRISETPN